MIISIGLFKLKKRSLLPEFLTLSKLVFKQALDSKGNLKSELDNEGISCFYSLTHWDSIESMKSFVHSKHHADALKNTQVLCKEASFLYFESDDFFDKIKAKSELKKNSKTRRFIY